MPSAITSPGERIELWKSTEGQKPRCESCMPLSITELAKTGCECGIQKMDVRSPEQVRKDNAEAIRKWAEKERARLDRMQSQLDEMRQTPIRKEPVITKEDIRKRRDEWVAKNRRDGESEYEARSRFWAENPGAKAAERGATSAPVEKAEPTMGETVTAAIDRKARDLHLEGRYFDKSLPEVRGIVRKLVPGLADLERSTKSYSVAKSEIAKDATKSEALAFVDRWSE